MARQALPPHLRAPPTGRATAAMQKHEGSRHLASAERGRRPRWTPTETDKALLETIFVADSFPTFSVRKQLAEQLNVDSRQVQKLAGFHSAPPNDAF